MMFDNTILQTKDFFHFEYTHLVDSKEEFFKEPSNEYKGSIIQINDE